MAGNHQAKIWSFITEYKRVTGNNLPYVGLIQNKSTFRQLLMQANKLGDAELEHVATALLKLLEKDELRFIGKSYTGKRIVKPVRVERHSSQALAKVTGSVEEQYRQLIKDTLESTEMTFVQRQELDTFCRRRIFDHGEALTIENAVRAELDLEPVSWSTELRSSLRRLINFNGTLTETDRLALFNIYMKKQRLPAAEGEAIMLEEIAALKQRDTTDRGTFTRSMWVLGSLVFVLILAVLGLYMREADGPQWADISREAPEYPAEIRVSGSITEDTLWRAATTYRLTTPVFVEGDARLTIEPGTRIIGEFGSALIVTRDAQLNAQGQYNAPIVFTSAKPEGQRQRGDWGGVVLLGNGLINRPVGQIEGIDANDVRGHFGGQDHSDSCGVLSYVRVEFAGFEVFADNELNGLTLGGCGTNTVVRYVQVHKAADDGIEMFGGAADLKYILITGAKDDSLDWDMGWRGRVQFLVIQQHDDAGDNAFEADNWGKDHNATPRSKPIIYNATLIGAANPVSGQRAMNLRRGTAGDFHNFIIMGHSKEAIDIRDQATVDQALSNHLVLTNSLFYQIGKEGEAFFADELGAKDDDGGFAEDVFFRGQDGMVFGIDPGLTAAQDPLSPNFVPNSLSPASAMAAPIPEAEFWDDSANFIGALRPGVDNTWLDGWSAFAEN